MITEDMICYQEELEEQLIEANKMVFPKNTQTWQEWDRDMKAHPAYDYQISLQGINFK